MKNLYFCRHGESTYNLEGLYAGQTDVPLTRLGREQAQAAGRVAGTVRIDAIASSTLQRALETAQIIAGEIGFDVHQIVTDDIFMERALGELEGKPYDFAPEDEGSSGVESMENLERRAAEGLATLRKMSADNVLLVSHGSFGRALQKVINPSLDYNTLPELPNARIIKLL